MTTATAKTQVEHRAEQARYLNALMDRYIDFRERDINGHLRQTTVQSYATALRIPVEQAQESLDRAFDFYEKHGTRPYKHL